MTVFLSVLMVSLATAACHDAPRDSSIASVQDEPVAVAGANITVFARDTFILNGSGSTGFEGADALNYTWSVLYETHTFSYYGMAVELSFPREGASVANLTVRDSLNRTSWDEVTIIINERPQTFLEKYLLTILILGIIGAILAYFVILAVLRVNAGQAVVSEARREKMVLASRRYGLIMKKVMRNPMGFIGVVVLTFFGLLAIFGP